MFGKNGYHCTTVPEIETAVKEYFENDVEHLNIINIAIDPTSERKPQDFSWLTESKL